MDTSKLVNWLQVGGNIGIIVGVVLIAVLINQNSKITATDMRSRSWELAMQSDITLMGENPAAAWSKASRGIEELTDEELTVIHAYLNFWSDHRNRNAYIETTGFFDDTNYSVDYDADYIFGGNPTSMAWWTHRESSLTAEWTERVGDILESSPAGFSQLLDQMRTETN